MVDLRPLLAPAAVAVVGASPDPGKVGHRPLRFLLDHGYRGRIYPVNPGYPEILQLRCYPSLRDLPEVPEAVAIIVAAARVPEVLAEAAALGVRAAVIISSGFAEAGPAGARLQEEVAEIARRSGMAVCGPNTVGLVHTGCNLALTFSEALTRGRLLPGPVGFVSQSGAFGTVILALARERGIGIRTYINSGNEAHLELADYLAHLVADPEIRVIGGYVEGIRNGPAFLAAARQALARRKPVVLVKVGRSERGTRAAACHTGAAAGLDQEYEAAFHAAGIIRARDEQELLDLLEAFQAVPRLPRGRRVAVVTMSGGAGILLADQLAELGLELADLTPDTAARLRRLLPPYASILNPIDVTGQFVTSSAGLAEVLAAVAADPQVDSVVVFTGLAWATGEGWSDGMRQAAAAAGKPLLAVWPAAAGEPVARLRAAGVPVLGSPHRAAAALAALVRYSETVGRPAEAGDAAGAAAGH